MGTQSFFEYPAFFHLLVRFFIFHLLVQVLIGSHQWAPGHFYIPDHRLDPYFLIYTSPVNIRLSFGTLFYTTSRSV